MGGAAVGKVVAVHRCDDDVCELQARYQTRQTARLQRVGRRRASVRDIAERAAARAAVAQYHEGRRAARETLIEVRAFRLFADGVQATFAQRAPQLPHARIGDGLDSQPTRFGKALIMRGDNGGASCAYQFVRTAPVGRGGCARCRAVLNAAHSRTIRVARNAALTLPAPRRWLAEFARGAAPCSTPLTAAPPGCARRPRRRFQHPSPHRSPPPLKTLRPSDAILRPSTYTPGAPGRRRARTPQPPRKAMTASSSRPT